VEQYLGYLILRRLLHGWHDVAQRRRLVREECIARAAGAATSTLSQPRGASLHFYAAFGERLAECGEVGGLLVGEDDVDRVHHPGRDPSGYHQAISNAVRRDREIRGGTIATTGSEGRRVGCPARARSDA
jgi:hypothetical protein